MKKIFFNSILALSIIFLSTNESNSQWIKNGQYGGYFSSFATSGTNIFAGSVQGVFLSTNNGINWAAVNNGLTNLSVTSLTISGTNIFAGTVNGEDGVFLSTDNGTNWTVVNNGLTNRWVYSLTTSGTNIFAGTLGGVFLSTNNGSSWTAVNNGIWNMNVWSLTSCGSYLFAGTWGTLFRSTNNGTNWTAIALPILSFTAFATYGTNVFAGTWAGGVYLSTDYGSSWTEVNNGLSNLIIRSLTVSGSNVFAGSDGGGVYRSTNNGTSWVAINTGLLNLYVTAIITSGSNVFAGTWGSGIWQRPLSEVIQSLIAPILLSPLNNSLCQPITPLFDWTDVPGAASYGLQVSNDPAFNTLMINQTGLTTSEYSVATGTLQNNVLYYWRVNASNSAGSGAWSDIWSFTTLNPLSVNAGEDTTIYYGYGNGNAILTAAANGGNGQYSYLWSNNATTQTIIVSPNTTTNYTVTITDECNSTISDEVTVNVVDVRCGNNKILVCHNGHTICISPNAVPAHLAHGDYLGNCGDQYVTMPTEYELHDNYPNPFNPVTSIKYSLPFDSKVSIKIFDVIGREIATLVNDNQKAGYYSVDFNASNLSSGIYFYRMIAGDFVAIKKMVLVK